jgi:DNA-binding response OmpR family regulator
MEGEKKKILIVDDDGFLLDMYAYKFSQNNFEVHTALGGKEAIAKLKDGLTTRHHFDGYHYARKWMVLKCLKKINTEKLSENSAKIILSNKGQQEDIDRGMSLGSFRVYHQSKFNSGGSNRTVL